MPAAASIRCLGAAVVEPLLRTDRLVKRFGGLVATDTVSIDVRPGEIHALIGPNGAGKTTLFNVVTGFQHGDDGAVLYDGRAILGRPAWAIARRGLVRTFQITKALAAMPVIDNMTLAAPHQPGEHITTLIARPRATRRREHEVEERAGELLETFGLATKRDEYAGTLSGGQRKLLELARVLMAEPRMVLLDEPMAGVNPTLGGRLLEHVHALRERDGTTFLLIEHDMEVVMGHSDRVVCMAQGTVIAEGAPEAVRNDPRVIDAYLGGGAT
jgi:branched-chain amino acid transport system ATP-binding protein